LKFRTTLILLAIAVALAIFIVLTQRPPTEVRKEEEKMVLSIRGEQAVEKMRIQGSHGTILLEKVSTDPVTKTTKWKIKEPVIARADDTAVQPILSKLEFLAKARTIKAEEAEGLSGEDTGLEPPRFQITLWDKEGKGETLEIGSENPLRQNRYARIKGKKEIYLIDRNILSTLDKSLFDLRAKNPIDIDPYKVKSLDISVEGAEAMRLIREGTTWKFEKPLEVRADDDKVQNLLRDLSELKVEKFVSEDATADAAKYGLDKPKLKISLTEDGRTLSALFSIHKEKVAEKEEEREKAYIRVETEHSIAEVEPYKVKDFSPTFESLRNRNIVYFSTFDVQELTIKNSSETIALKKEDFDWKMTSPKELAAERSAVTEVLDELENLKAREFVSDNPADAPEFGLDKPSITLSWLRGKEREKGSLSLGKTDKEKKLVYLKVDGRDTIYAVDLTFRDLLNRNHLAYREKTIFDFPTYKVRALTVERGGMTFSLELRETIWFLTKPVEAKANEPVVLDVLSDMGSLKCNSYLGDDVKDFKPYGLDEPRYSVNVTLEDGSEHKLLIGKVVSESELAARTAGSDAVFSIPRTIVEHLEREFHDVEVFNFQPKEVIGLNLEGKESVEIARVNEVWKGLKPSPFEPDLVKLADTLDKLSQLNAIKYVAYSPTDLKPFGLDKPSLKVEVKFKDGSKKILVGSKVESDYHAKFPDSEGVFLVPGNLIEPLFGTAESFTKKETKEELPKEKGPAEEIIKPKI